MTDTAEPSTGARFIDKDGRDLGFARKVTPRIRAISGKALTVFDISGAEPALALSLSRLDRSRMRIQFADPAAVPCRFRWASGYVNGTEVRLQGELEHPRG